MICAETFSLRLARHDHELESIPASAVTVGPRQSVAIAGAGAKAVLVRRLRVFNGALPGQEAVAAAAGAIVRLSLWERVMSRLGEGH
jgi:hypothetical protein